MELEIQGFKNYSHYCITIHKGTTLIRGPSGIGKSTIFEAIRWLLYGHIRDVDPWNNPKAKTKVTLQYQQFKITRSKRSNRLLVELNQELFEDQTAQELINETFGDRLVWEATGYIDEEASNTLFQLTPQQRLNVLTKLIFRDDNPEEEINKIKLKLEEKKQQYESAKAIAEERQREYDQWYQVNSEDITIIEEDGIPQYPLEELLCTSDQLKQQLSNLQLKAAKQALHLKRLVDLEQQLKEINVKLSIPIKLEELEAELVIASRREDINRNKYFKCNVELNLFTQQDYQNTVDRENELAKLETILLRYQLNKQDYNDTVIQLRKKVSNANTDFFPLVKRKQELAKKLIPVCHKPTHFFTLTELLQAKEYETIQAHNSSLEASIRRLNLQLTLEQMEIIVSNEHNYSLLNRKLQLANQIAEITVREAPILKFSLEDYQEALRLEKQRELIDKYKLTREHFELEAEIEKAYELFIRYGDSNLPTFTEQDLLDAKLLEEYYRIYGTTNYAELLQLIGKANLYYKFAEHLQLFELYGSKVLSSIIVTKRDLERIRNELFEAENIAEILQCPHCGKDVYYKERKLHKLAKNYTGEQLEELRRKCQDYQLYYELQERKKLLGSFPNIGKLTEYANYKSCFKGENYLAEPPKLRLSGYSSNQIAKQLEFQHHYNKLSEKVKKYYSQSTQLHKQLLQANTGYCEVPKYSSQIIQQTIQQNAAYEKYLKLQAEYDSIQVAADLEVFSGDITKVKECLALHRQLKVNIEDPGYSSSYITQCLKEAEQYLKYKEAKDEYDSILIPNQLIVSPAELDIMKSQLQDLESVKLVDEPEFSSQYILQSLEKTKLLTELNHLPITRSVRELKCLIVKEKKLKHEQDVLLALKQHLEAEKQEIIIDYQLDRTIEDLTEELNAYEQEILVTKLYQEYLARQQKLKDYQQKAHDLFEQLLKTEELLKTAIDTVYQCLAAFIYNINNSISLILEHFFNVAIEVRLEMFKQLKTKDILKPEIHLNIRYKGGVINNIKRLSKGERYRVILAVTLSLNKLTKIPMLLLDETLAHIDQELKEAVTNVLKEYAQNKHLVLIAHDIITGIYDHLIELE